ncbi:kinase-like protein [Polyporus arcularius HHB13444]|uniref:Kinase-like protein n=1 Tax=Polyporus arcularius HHB13444 TaxID=1314778 RepID=A0A5C3PLE3_9APHY|nr:kinase-like protein [Polyporus arcularius HHB13444]
MTKDGELIEEERVPWYDPKDFYPIRIGEVFQSRYQVVGKLGYGGYSTVWLCRDLVGHCHVAVKVCSRNAIPIKRELAALEHLNDLPKTKHAGRQFIRTLLDRFELTSNDVPSRSFQCLVFKPMAESIWAFREGRRLSQWLLKDILYHILLALDYLHSEAKLIHADIQEKNILLSLDDTEALQAYEEGEQTSPVARKIDGDRVIYLSRPIEPKQYGPPYLCDFGEARIGRTTYTGLIQPEQYRAPEVILGMPWNEKVDIWSVGVMIWNMFQGKNMFKVTGGPEDEAHDRYHIAHMVSLLGPPPVDFLKRSETGEPWKYFDAQGNWIGAADLPDDSLELSEKVSEGENKAQFLNFVRKMVALAWKPEDRFNADELLKDAWLLARD